MQQNLTSFETITLLILKEIRLERGVHQAQVAERCGKTASAWTKIENGDNSLSLPLFFQACNALGVNISSVIATAERYASLISNHKWCILTGSLENTENDLLKMAQSYYSSPGFKSRIPVLHWNFNINALNTPIYNQDGSVNIIDVFRFALDPTFRDQQAPTLPIK